AVEGGWRAGVRLRDLPGDVAAGGLERLPGVGVARAVEVRRQQDLGAGFHDWGDAFQQDLQLSLDGALLEGEVGVDHVDGVRVAGDGEPAPRRDARVPLAGQHAPRFGRVL